VRGCCLAISARRVKGRLTILRPAAPFRAIEHLAGIDDVVAGGPEVVDERWRDALELVVACFTRVALVVHSTVIRGNAIHGSRARSQADRCRAVGVLEDDAARRERVE